MDFMQPQGMDYTRPQGIDFTQADGMDYTLPVGDPRDINRDYNLPVGDINNIASAYNPKKQMYRDFSFERGNSEIAQEAANWVGRDYKAGQTERCADFVSHVLSRATGSSYHETYVPNIGKQGVRVDGAENLRPGDVVLFDRTYMDTDLTHVGIYTGNGEFVHRPTANRPVEKASLNSKYWSERLNSGRRISQDKDVPNKETLLSSKDTNQWMNLTKALARSMVGDQGADIIARQFMAESGYNKNAKSGAGAMGISQFMPDTLKATLSSYNAYMTKETGRPHNYTEQDFKENPRLQILLGTYHMKELLSQNDGDWAAALAAYNAGQGGLQQMRSNGKAFSETKHYVADILHTSPAKAEQMILHGFDETVIPKFDNLQVLQDTEPEVYSTMGTIKKMWDDLSIGFGREVTKKELQNPDFSRSMDFWAKTTAAGANAFAKAITLNFGNLGFLGEPFDPNSRRDIKEEADNLGFFAQALVGSKKNTLLDMFNVMDSSSFLLSTMLMGTISSYAKGAATTKDLAGGVGAIAQKEKAQAMIMQVVKDPAVFTKNILESVVAQVGSNTSRGKIAGLLLSKPLLMNAMTWGGLAGVNEMNDSLSRALVEGKSIGQASKEAIMGGVWGAMQGTLLSLVLPIGFKVAGDTLAKTPAAISGVSKVLMDKIGISPEQAKKVASLYKPFSALPVAIKKQITKAYDKLVPEKVQQHMKTMTLRLYKEYNADMLLTKQASNSKAVIASMSIAVDDITRESSNMQKVAAKLGNEIQNELQPEVTRLTKQVNDILEVAPDLVPKYADTSNSVNKLQLEIRKLTNYLSQEGIPEHVKPNIMQKLALKEKSLEREGKILEGLAKQAQAQKVNISYLADRFTKTNGKLEQVNGKIKTNAQYIQSTAESTKHLDLIKEGNNRFLSFVNSDKYKNNPDHDTLIDFVDNSLFVGGHFKGSKGKARKALRNAYRELALSIDEGNIHFSRDFFVNMEVALDRAGASNRADNLVFARNFMEKRVKDLEQLPNIDVNELIAEKQILQELQLYAGRHTEIMGLGNQNLLAIGANTEKRIQEILDKVDNRVVNAAEIPTNVREMLGLQPEAIPLSNEHYQYFQSLKDDALDIIKYSFAGRNAPSLRTAQQIRTYGPVDEETAKHASELMRTMVGGNHRIANSISQAAKFVATDDLIAPLTLNTGAKHAGLAENHKYLINKILEKTKVLSSPEMATRKYALTLKDANGIMKTKDYLLAEILEPENVRVFSEFMAKYGKGAEGLEIRNALYTFKTLQGYLELNKHKDLVARGDHLEHYVAHIYPDYQEFLRVKNSTDTAMPTLPGKRKIMTISQAMREGAETMDNLRELNSASFKTESDFTKFIYGREVLSAPKGVKLSKEALKLQQEQASIAKVWTNKDRWAMLYPDITYNGNTRINGNTQDEIINDYLGKLLRRKPITDPVKLMSISMHANMWADETGMLIQSLRNTEVGEGGHRLIMFKNEGIGSGSRAVGVAHVSTGIGKKAGGYIPLSDLKGMGSVRLPDASGKLMSSSDMFIHPEAAKILQDRFMRTPESNIGKQFNDFARIANNLQLMGSHIPHYLNIYSNVLASSSFDVGTTNTLYDLGEHIIREAPEVLQDFQMSGGAPGSLNRFLENVYAGFVDNPEEAARFLLPSAQRAKQSVIRKVAGSTTDIDEAIMTKVLFEPIQNAQLGSWLHKIEQIKHSKQGQELFKKHGLANYDLYMKEVKELAATEVNVLTGSLPTWWNSSSTLKVIRKILLTPQWTGSMFSIVQGAFDSATQKLGAKSRFSHLITQNAAGAIGKGTQKFAEKNFKNFLIKAGVGSVVFANLMNYYLNGHSCAENPPGRQLDIKINNGGPRGATFIPNPLFGFIKNHIRAVKYGASLAMPNNEYVAEDADEINSITRQAYGRLNTVFQTMIDLQKNTNTFGTPIIENPEEGIVRKASNIKNYMVHKLMPVTTLLGRDFSKYGGRDMTSTEVAMAWVGGFVKDYNLPAKMRSKLTTTTTKYTAQLRKEMDEIFIKAAQAPDGSKEQQDLLNTAWERGQQGISIDRGIRFNKKRLADILEEAGLATRDTSNKTVIRATKEIYENLYLSRFFPDVYNERLVREALRGQYWDAVGSESQEPYAEQIGRRGIFAPDIPFNNEAMPYDDTEEEGLMGMQMLDLF